MWTALKERDMTFIKVEEAMKMTRQCIRNDLCRVDRWCTRNIKHCLVLKAREGKRQDMTAKEKEEEVTMCNRTAQIEHCLVGSGRGTEEAGLISMFALLGLIMHPLPCPFAPTPKSLIFMFYHNTSAHSSFWPPQHIICISPTFFFQCHATHIRATIILDQQL